MTDGEEERWSPIESSPEALTTLFTGICCAGYAFVELLSTDEEYLKTFTVQPLCAVLIHPAEKKNDATDEGGNAKSDRAINSTMDDVMFFKQYIINACGTVAMLHAALNVYKETPAARDTFIAALAQSLEGKTPAERGKLIASNEVIKRIHNSAACINGKEDICRYHYCTLVERGGYLYELDGRKSAPIVWSKTSKTTFLNDAVAVLKKFMAQSQNDYGFNMLVLVKSN